MPCTNGQLIEAEMHALDRLFSAVCEAVCEGKKKMTMMTMLAMVTGMGIRMMHDGDEIDVDVGVDEMLV